jgi:hypothetical protein
MLFLTFDLLMWDLEVTVHVVDIGGSVDNHLLSFHNLRQW